MKAIKWAGAGASLLDPAYAHLIPPRYEDGLLQAAESPNTLGQDCGVLSASGACQAPTGAAAETAIGGT